MGSICGIYNKKGNSVDEQDIKNMLFALNHWNANFQWFVCKENVAFGKLSFQPVKKNDISSFFISTFHENKEKSNQLLQENDINKFRNVTDDFAFASFQKNILTLGCDHFGCKPLFYFDSENIFAFASEIKGLFPVFDIQKKLSDEWMLDLLSNSISDKEITPYKGIKKLKPGNILEVTKHETKQVKYWNLQYSKNKDITEQEAICKFRDLLAQSIEEKSLSSYPVGSELSGGLDSSVIASVANSFCLDKNIPFYTFSHINPDYHIFPFNDEKSQIREIVNHAQIKNCVFVDSKGKKILDRIDQSLNLMDGPTQQRFYLFSDNLYEKAEENNVHTLLSGFGGDEMVSSQTPGYFHELATTEWMHFFSGLMKTKKSLSKKIKATIEISIAAKMPWIYNSWLTFAGQERKRISVNLYKNNALKKEIIKKYDMVDRALSKSRFPNQSNVHERQYERIMHAHVSQRLEYSAIAALHHKIEYRYPLLDVRLIEFYYSLPTHLKIKGNTKRYLYRKAIKGIVPDSIRWRNDKSGATIPSIQYRFLNDYENIKNFILHCRKNGVGDEFFNFDTMLKWQETIKYRTEKDKIPVHQGQFFNFLMLLRFLDKF